MSLLKPTNNLISNIYVAGTKNVVPEVGMGATLCYYSDRHAGTVIDVSGDIIKVQQDNAKRTDKYGMSDVQEYEYTPNPDGPIYCFRRRKDDSSWEYVYFNESTGRWKKGGTSPSLILGRRDEYYDFSF